jgi:hypothetical protein
MIIYSFFIYYFVMEHNWTCVVIPLYYFDAKIRANTTARDHRSTLLLPAPAGPLPHQLSKAIYVRILIG